MMECDLFHTNYLGSNNSPNSPGGGGGEGSGVTVVGGVSGGGGGKVPYSRFTVNSILDFENGSEAAHPQQQQHQGQHGSGRRDSEGGGGGDNEHLCIGGSGRVGEGGHHHHHHGSGSGHHGQSGRISPTSIHDCDNDKVSCFSHCTSVSNEGDETDESKLTEDEIGSPIQLGGLCNESEGLHHHHQGHNVTVRMSYSPTVQKPQTKCVVTGWGRTSEESNHSIVLKEVVTPLWSSDNCERRLRQNFGSNFNLPLTSICAGDEGSHSSICDGDGGAPLACLGESDGKWYHEGIVSFGIGCGRKDSPGVYTRVSSYLEWIRSFI